MWFFILPSIVEQGDLAIAVSTGGREPRLAKKLRTDLEAAYGREYAIFVADHGGAAEKIIADGQQLEPGTFEGPASTSPCLDHIPAEKWAEVKALMENSPSYGGGTAMIGIHPLPVPGLRRRLRRFALGLREGI